MKNKLVLNIVAAYFILLAIVLIIQLPKKDNVVAESVVPETKYEDKLKNTVIMFVDSPIILVNKKQMLIDKNDSDITPVIIDDVSYVPAKFLSNVYNANISLSKENTGTIIRLNNKAMVFNNEKKELKVVDNTSESIKKIQHIPQIVNNTTYIPLKLFTDVFEKEVFYDNGFIMIYNKDSNFDIDSEKENLQKLRNKVSILPSILTERKLNSLLDEKPNIFDLGKKFVENTIEKNDNILQKPDEENINNENNISNIQFSLNFKEKFIKTDDYYLYYADKEEIKVIDMDINNNFGIVSSLKFNTHFDPNEILLYKDYLIAIGNEKNSINNYVEKGKNIDIDNEFNTDYCSIYIYNKSNKNNIKLVRKISIDGNFYTLKQTDNQLYIVSNVDAKNLINSKGYYMPPSYLDSLYSKGRKYLDYNEIMYFPDMNSSIFTCISTINLDNIDEKANFYSFLGSSSDIYLSNKNIYFTIYKENDIDLTSIYKFSIDINKIEYKGKGQVKGKIIKNVVLDEYNNYLRIATEFKDIENNKNYYNIFVLNNNLDICGNLEKIPIEDEIYSLSFLENKAYIVTSNQENPISVVNLENYKKPIFMGNLNIPEYSQYLQPYGDRHLISIGKHTFDSDGINYKTHFKLSMLDITDLNEPKEIFYEFIGDRGTESYILENQNSLFVDKINDIIAFPINETKNLNPENPGDYGIFEFQGGYVYKFNLKDKFEFLGKVSHLNDEDYENIRNGNEIPNKLIKKVICTGKYVISISDKVIYINNINDFSEVKEVSFS